MHRVGAFDALGFGFDVAVDDARVAGRIECVFQSLVTTTAAEHHYVLDAVPGSDPPDCELRLDGSSIVALPDLDGLVQSLVHDLNRRATDASPHLVLHAGGVEHHGVGVVLPGVMEAGKTTLTAGLVRAGLGYLTDEAVALDRTTLAIHPYPKPLSLDPGSWSLFPELEDRDDIAATATQWQVPPTAIGPGLLGQSCPVGLIVFPRHTAGAAVALEPVGRAEALVELAHHTIRFDEQARQGLELLAEVIRGAECYRLVAGELDDAVAAVTSLLGMAPSAESAR